MQLLAQAPHISIFLDEQNNWLYARWFGDQNLETVKSGCEKMLAQVRKTGVSKVLNDNRDVTSAWSDAANWGGTVWFPAMAAAGVDFFSWIYSPHAFSRLSTDISIGYTRGEVAIATFDNEQEAADWLRAQT